MATMQRPWPLAKGNGFVLASEFLPSLASALPAHLVGAKCRSSIWVTGAPEVATIQGAPLGNEVPWDGAETTPVKDPHTRTNGCPGVVLRSAHSAQVAQQRPSHLSQNCSFFGHFFLFMPTAFKRARTKQTPCRNIPTQTILVGLGKRSNCLFMIQQSSSMISQSIKVPKPGKRFLKFPTGG
jgi:hypothetical protein